MDTYDLAPLAARARALIVPGRRRILGITGPPGAGKSTLAAALVEALDGAAVLVPMDGFHLAGAELERLGRAQRKGAPDTFDAAGYAALLRRLRDTADPAAVVEGSTADGETAEGQAAGGDTAEGSTAGGGTVYAPVFDRALEEPIAGSVAVGPGTPLVVTEGNYLLLDDGPWTPVRGLLDEVWYLEIDPEVRVRRLVDRHVRFGRPRPAAERWVTGCDEANARLVRAGRDRADLVVRPRTDEDVRSPWPESS
ncbi:nucleoside triphosphate hydrolase [Streptomyces sp. AM 2-1-1]|uniref:nucleoside triphosphate hydrolase n=1 Tax=Streptomyces sp. AM 2-1-1 TaxID=3028709 RepID=UPI0023B96FE9|nr:nucleoside triphosphate hydrolase [Streptomyces sp. AM 2-1-1]WEH38970.1 nucleoside triphosphate hydrolase [Streptomyces sp. AM 2-1-1]